MNIVKKINEHLDPYYALFITLGLFGTVLIAIYNFIISPTDLKVVIQTDEMNYPAGIVQNYETIFRIIPKNSDDLSYKAIGIYNFLITTTDLKTITIENVGDKTLRGIKFKHLNTDAITAYTITSDTFDKEEEAKLYENLIYDDKRSLVYLKDLIDLPPKSSIKIRLWGSFKKSLLDNDILISYEDGDAYFEKSYNVTGIKGYFVQFGFEFLFVLIIIFIIIYHYGLKHALKKHSEKAT